MDQRPKGDTGQEWVPRDPDDSLRRLPDASFLGDRGWIWRRQADDDEQTGRKHQDDRDWFPPFEHSPSDKVGGPIVSRDEPPKPNDRSHREGDPVAVFAQSPNRAIAHRSAGDAKMNTGEEKCSQNQ